jgi:phosphatidylglycerophosphate synthase
MKPAERLRRQVAAEPALLVADASAVVDDAAVRWLIENPGKVLASEGGKPLAVVVEQGTDPDRALGSAGLPVHTAGSIGERYIRKLRRKTALLAISLDETPSSGAERQLFDKVYKGVTDLVTKYVWPVPAFYVTRLCARLNIKPNTVTITGMVMMLVAAWLFWVGEFVGGLAAAWLMTFLDTVDGKLARVTAQSSKLGDKLDHGTDMLHPPLWWWAVAIGAAKLNPVSGRLLWDCFLVILICYVLARVVEEGFKTRFGFNAFLWQRFDSYFRLVVSRRNIVLLILTAGVLLDRLTESWIVAAAWSVVSLLVQTARLVMGLSAARRAELRPWLG